MGRRLSAVPAKIGTYLILGILFVVVVYPLFWTFMSSLKENWMIFSNPIGLPESIFLKNYVKVWTSGAFGRYFLNSIVITGSSVVGILLLSTMAGYGFARYRFRGSNTIFLIFIMSMVITSVSIMISQYQLLSSLRLLDTFPGIILVYLSWTVFGIVMSRNAFSEVPQELIDAARIDGCNEAGIYFRIVLPLIKPTFATIGIFMFVWIWNDFIWPLVLLQRPGQETVTLGLMTLRGQYLSNWGVLTAGLSITIMPVLVVYFTFQRNFVRGLTMGALKG